MMSDHPSFAEKLYESLRAVAKLLLVTHRCRLPHVDTAGRPLIILANGPSLAATIDAHLPYLQKSDTLAVNFAANTPEFLVLRPRFYLLADPHFFNNSTDPNVAALISNIRSVEWEMTLFVPFGAKFNSGDNPNLTVVHYNAVGAYGFDRLQRALYDSHRAMPRPRNVLIPAIMLGIWLGYKEIYLTGADHSWTRTLSVDDDNRLVSVQPHFYKEDPREQRRVEARHNTIRLHSMLESFAIAFKSYHDIAAYAARHGVAIYNATPGSFIDAFPRRLLPFAE